MLRLGLEYSMNNNLIVILISFLLKVHKYSISDEIMLHKGHNLKESQRKDVLFVKLHPVVQQAFWQHLGPSVL